MPTAGAHRELAIRRHPLRPPLRESVENILTAHPSSCHSTQFSAISTSATANEVTCATPALELYFLGLVSADSICYMSSSSLLARLELQAREADRLHELSRRLLVNSARAGASAGLSQREIARAIGRSQPEVSRLLRFHGVTALGRGLHRNRVSILRMLTDAGGTNVRVFGSVARGDDHPDSDVDLLVDFTKPPSLFTLGRLEAQIGELVQAEVDIVPAGGLKPHVAKAALREAIAL